MPTEKSPLLPTNIGGHRPSQRHTKWGAGLAVALICSIFGLALVVSLVLLIIPVSNHPGPQPFRIAIIGAGPAGVFTAAHLRKLSGNLGRPLEIEIFERKATVGGRLTPESPLHPFGDPHQPALVAESASYGSLSTGLTDILKNYGVNPQLHNNVETVGYHFYSNYDLVRPSSAASVWSRAWEFWCFGYSTGRSKDFGQQSRQRIRRIHSLPTLNSIQDLVKNLDLGRLRSQTPPHSISDNGISKWYTDKVLKGEMAIQYGQDLDSLSGLALSMAAYDADEGKGQAGGNLKSILERVLASSRVNLHLSTDVIGIRKVNSTYWVLAYREPGTASDTAAFFDGIILAAPYVSSELEVRNSSLAVPPVALSYVPRHITWFTLPSPSNNHEILPEDRSIIHRPSFWPSAAPAPNFIELRHLGPLVRRRLPAQQEHLYRIFSSDRIEDAQIERLLSGSNPTWIARHEIPLAYPRLAPGSSLPPIVCDSRIWHTGAVEAVGNRVELSAWMGKNIAGLIAQELKRDIKSTLTAMENTTAPTLGSPLMLWEG
ncbi:hypothetical protein AOQ84DRAFT_374926 [Glonium stellatum]|uniref:Prenylcysteine lyase domain-containing protein n=1 Tax=Glonium stellatum TaxID=574774 RepID=A0A8E2JV72_9PEZI|nr:hypothetical protein AOQ84DRAFT_374926 [Glonium stellatum]